MTPTIVFPVNYDTNNCMTPKNCWGEGGKARGWVGVKGCGSGRGGCGWGKVWEGVEGWVVGAGGGEGRGGWVGVGGGGRAGGVGAGGCGREGMGVSGRRGEEVCRSAGGGALHEKINIGLIMEYCKNHGTNLPHCNTSFGHQT